MSGFDEHVRTLEEVAGLVREADAILFVTGAGLSADSGLPTYRGVGGLYDDRDTEDGVPIEIALSGSMFQSRPDVTWRYLWEIGAACAGVEPNDGHRFIARVSREKPEAWVLTQNVDGLHREADTRNLVELHGHAFDLYCTRCGESADVERIIGRYEGERPELPPSCEQCDGIVRPDVTLFGESLPNAALDAFTRLESIAFDVVFAVGTSAMFPYVVQPVVLAASLGIPTVEINPGETDLGRAVRHRLPMGAGEAGRRLDELVWPA